MKLLEFNRNPSDRQLRQFGGMLLLALPLVGWLWGATGAILATLALAGLLLAAVGMVLPKLMWPLFIVLMVIAMPIGFVVGELSMIVIYFGLFLPMGLAFRAIGRDALNLKRDRNTDSYWQVKKQPQNVVSYYRQS